MFVMCNNENIFPIILLTTLLIKTGILGLKQGIPLYSTIKLNKEHVGKILGMILVLYVSVPPAYMMLSFI